MRAAWIVLGIVSIGCSSGASSPQPLGDDPSGAAPTSSADSVPCSDGAVAMCKTPPVVHGNVTSCGVGVRACVAGQWGPCGGEANGTSIQSFTFTASCPANTTPVWSKVSYDAVTPSNASGASSVALHVQTADSRHPAALIPDQPAALKDPKDVRGALGGHPGDLLIVRAVLTPTPDHAAHPTVSAILPDYYCN